MAHARHQPTDRLPHGRVLGCEGNPLLEIVFRLPPFACSKGDKVLGHGSGSDYVHDATQLRNDDVFQMLVSTALGFCRVDAIVLCASPRQVRVCSAGSQHEREHVTKVMSTHPLDGDNLC